MPDNEIDDNTLILAAEECPLEHFLEYHSFTRYEDIIINRLIAHGPVLLRGGRGSGKSALLIASHLRMREKYSDSIIPVYISLRHLPLLQSQGTDYVSYFCRILSREVNKEFSRQFRRSFPISKDVSALLDSLEANAQLVNRRIVLLFDDAAHIGRERPLDEFFDIFRTISTSRISCKASIYPGVTKFGVRFDVFNDATVIDISRDERKTNFTEIFKDIIRLRFSSLVPKIESSRVITLDSFAFLMGRAVCGNLRSFLFACNNYTECTSIGLPEINECMLQLASNYFWPLLDEVAPKLGSYEVLAQSAGDVAQIIFQSCARKGPQGTSYILIHRDVMQRYSKIFEILEYAGFIGRRDASRAMKSGGRGALFAANLCNILELITGRRVTRDLVDYWLSNTEEPYEMHISNAEVSKFNIPEADEQQALSILEKPIADLRKSNIYPYGLTDDKINRLEEFGINTVIDLMKTSDDEILSIHMIGPKGLKRIRDVVLQAVWM